MPADRWDLLVKALAAKPRAMDSKRGWIALAQDWAPECPKAMDAGNGWDALCRGWSGGAAMDEQERDTSGRFGSGGGTTASVTPAESNESYGKKIRAAGVARRAASAPGAMKININPEHAAAAHKVDREHPMQTPIKK